MNLAISPRRLACASRAGPRLSTSGSRDSLPCARGARRCFGPEAMLPRLAVRPFGRSTRTSAIEHSPDIASGGLQAALVAYRAELNRFLVARRASADDIEDILQDLYIKVRGLKTAPVAEPRAYLYKMAANLLADRRRSAARRATRERLWTETQLNLETEIDERPSAEQVVSGREELDLVLDAISSLPARTIEVLRRYRIDGDVQSAIAADLGISLSAVEKHLQRAYRAVIEAQARLDADYAPRRHSEAQD